MTPVPSTRQRTIPQQERQTTKRLTEQSTRRLTLEIAKRLKEALPAAHFCQVTASTTATVSSGGHVMIGPPLTHTGQV